MSITYRDAVPDDAEALASVFARCFTDTFGHLYKAEDLAAFLDPLDAEAWERELRDPALAMRVAEEDGRLVAFGKVGAVALPVTPERPAAELRQLYVLKPWHGQGIAEELMDWALERVRAMGAEEVYLSVYVDNHRARRFYERYGFRFVQPYDFMVGNHADEDHILRLDLKERG
ncbi:MAG TPA: GNAT family N-acetyltransferase [Allosphingosinicella sp.]|uniref:GNAT family N-acetyltransferase n=1 Tax=Allosphingosinicella sp. TaxID=2823234 RepID=UPI002ED93B42